MLARTAFSSLRTARRPKFITRPEFTQRQRGRWLLPALRALLALIVLSSPLTASAESEPHRALPDYDGRAGKGQPTTPGQALLWVPRVLLFPVYLVTEYVVRRPLGYAITAAERAELPAALYDFFAFGPDHKGGIVPVAFVDFGFYPSVGLYAFWDDAGFKGHSLRLRGSTAGSHWLSGAVSERFQLTPKTLLSINGSLIHRPDYAYYGIGPDTREADRSRYGADTADLHATLRAGFWRSSSIETSLGYRGASFYPGNFGDDPSLTQQVDNGVFPLPDGYTDGYRAGFQRSILTLDTRRDEDGSESGGRLVLRGEHGLDPTQSRAAGWLRYGASLGGFLDLDNRGRILSLSAGVEMADPLGGQPVPFTELVTAGGNDRLPGFRDGRVRGRSGAAATLRYSWPIWIWLDGSLQAAVGNVYGEHLKGISWGESRFSGAIGMESRGSRDSVFQLLVGFGTETFNSGADLNSIRVVAGARSGF
ncbi:MAG TPA: hypothetical protein VER11_18730 [Polyangiaceae bacterium]|nr:hypothetical protein [Polyangiaceae bacterium]